MNNIEWLREQSFLNSFKIFHSDPVARMATDRVQ